MCSRLSVFSIITTDWLTNWWTMLVKLLLHLKNGKWINMDTWTPCTSVFNWHNYLWFEAFNCPYDYIIQLNTKNRYTNWKYAINTYNSVEHYISLIQLKPVRFQGYLYKFWHHISCFWSNSWGSFQKLSAKKIWNFPYVGWPFLCL